MIPGRRRGFLAQQDALGVSLPASKPGQRQILLGKSDECHQEHRNTSSLQAPRLGKAAQTRLIPARLPTVLTSCSRQTPLSYGWAGPARTFPQVMLGSGSSQGEVRDCSSSHAELDIGNIHSSTKHRLGLPKSHMSGMARTFQATHHGNCHSVPPGPKPQGSLRHQLSAKDTAPLSHCSPWRGAESLEPNNHQEFTADLSLQP